MDLTILYLAIAITFTYASYSLVAPFLPIELKAKGVAENESGWIFSIFSVSFLIGCAITGKLQGSFGRRNIVFWGMIIHSLANIAYGFSHFFYKGDSLYLPAILAIRFSQGLASAGVMTTAFAIATINYPTM